jgi:hypothetical protein
MASAAPTISLSMMPIWKSIAVATVGAGCGVVWACGAGEADGAAGFAWPSAPAAMLKIINRQKLLTYFIFFLPQ